MGFALMGFFKLTFGEINPFTLGFLDMSKSMVGSKIATDHNPIQLNDYSTMYSSPNGYFYFLILFINLVGVRVFNTKYPPKESQDITPLSHRDDDKNSTSNRRDSVQMDDLEKESEVSVIETESDFGIVHSNQISANTSRKNSDIFEFFDQNFSIQISENLSQTDSQKKSNVNSSEIFLKKFNKLQKKSSIIKGLLKFRSSPLFIEKAKPMNVLFVMMRYKHFRTISMILVIYYALTLYLSGNAFLTDLIIGFLLGKVYTRFFFRAFER
jgi:hypothetical protein